MDPPELLIPSALTTPLDLMKTQICPSSSECPELAPLAWSLGRAEAGFCDPSVGGVVRHACCCLSTQATYGAWSPHAPRTSLNHGESGEKGPCQVLVPHGRC